MEESFLRTTCAKCPCGKVNDKMKVQAIQEFMILAFRSVEDLDFFSLKYMFFSVLHNDLRFKVMFFVV